MSVDAFPRPTDVSPCRRRGRHYVKRAMITDPCPSDPVSVARRYFDALERSDRAALDELLDPALTQHELPNKLQPQGRVRDRAAMLADFERGKSVLRSQRYEVRNAVAQGDRVALEVTWTGTLAVPLGTLPAGAEMRASLAIFLELRAGRIVAQSNYDCFEPF
jgi:ketosteroid isomerase-like protein